MTGVSAEAMAKRVDDLTAVLRSVANLLETYKDAVPVVALEHVLQASPVNLKGKR